VIIMATRKLKEEDRVNWIGWLKWYGPGKFYDAFVETAQYTEGKCRNCRQSIYLDIIEGGGVPDWRTEDGDYGCVESPDTTGEGTGSHEPIKLTSQRRSS
jgi:hypothetical protein